MSTERAAPRELPGLIGIIAPIWREVFVAPVQEGRLRAVGWSDGVKLAVALSVAGYLAMMGLVMVSGLVTGLWSGPVAIGVHVLGLVGALGGLGLIVALGLLAAAQLGWLRWPVFLAAGGILVVQVLPALVLAYSGARLRFLVPVLVTVGLSWIALLVAVLRGSGRPVSLRRSYLVFGLVGYAMLVPPLATGFLLWGIGGDHDFTFTPTYYLIIFLVALVLPVAYASGASFVQLTVSAGNWLAVATIEALGRRARVVVPALCGLLLVANVLATLSQPRPASSWLVGGLSAGLAGLISWFFLARARRFATEEPELIVMVEHLGRGALAIGLAICLLLPWRETIAEPIPALLGFSTVGVLFFGLLWRVLTEAQWANGHSRGLPRNARVLLFCA